MNSNWSLRHILICEYTWGAIPLDYEWSIQTSIYQQMEIKLVLRGIIKPL